MNVGIRSGSRTRGSDVAVTILAPKTGTLGLMYDAVSSSRLVGVDSERR